MVSWGPRRGDACATVFWPVPLMKKTRWPPGAHPGRATISASSGARLGVVSRSPGRVVSTAFGVYEPCSCSSRGHSECPSTADGST